MSIFIAFFLCTYCTILLYDYFKCAFRFDSFYLVLINIKNTSCIINKHHQIYLASSKRHSLVTGLFNTLICVLLCLLCTNPLLSFILSLIHPIGQEFQGAESSTVRTRSPIKGFYEMGVIPLSLVYCTCFHPTFSSYVLLLSNSSGGGVAIPINNTRLFGVNALRLFGSSLNSVTGLSFKIDSTA